MLAAAVELVDDDDVEVLRRDAGWVVGGQPLYGGEHVLPLLGYGSVDVELPERLISEDRTERGE